MAAAAAGVAGSAVVAVSAPLYLDEIEAEDDRVVDLCLAEVKATAGALPKLKMRVDGRNEVFQQWELPEDEPEEESSLLDNLQRVVWTGRQINQELPNFPLFYHGPPSFDLDEESIVQPGRHTAVPAAELEWSANILSIKVLDSTVGYPINLYGSVFVRDDLDRKRVYLFRRDRDSAQLVESPEETLVLTGPSRGLVLTDNLFFFFNLKMRCDQQADDMDFSEGMLDYRASDRSMLVMNKLKTKASTIGIAFAPVSVAVEATIQIKVPEVFSIESYGKISAFIAGSANEISLFNSEACGSVIKIGDDGIKLWRRVVSVPIHRSLVLRVDTWDGDSKAKSRRSSTTIFTPQICGKDAACIHGSMQIKVSWSPMYIPEYDDKLGLRVIF